MQHGQAQPQPGNQGAAKVRYGVYDQQLPIGASNISVGDLRSNYQSVWSMPGDVEAFVGGNKVNNDYVIQAGEQLEFHRRAGEKG